MIIFFVSSIQGVTSNKKPKRSPGNNKESEEFGEVPGSQTQLEMAEDLSAVLFNPVLHISFHIHHQMSVMT